MTIAILDFDGYICKSFYANKDDMMDMQKAESILLDLYQSAVTKVKDYFKDRTSPTKIIPVVSGHSWKKDIYPSYKRQRKRDEYLGLYREQIINKYKPVMIETLEADEVIVMLADYLGAIGRDDYVVFSDDKDLRYYTERYCKINITEQIVEQDIMTLQYDQYCQMIIGDREDNIQGVPKVGEKTAPKLLNEYGFTLDGVIRIFKDKGIDIDQTLRDLLLIIPMSDSYLKITEPTYRVANQIIDGVKIDMLDVHNSIISQVQFLNDKVKSIYDEVAA